MTVGVLVGAPAARVTVGEEPTQADKVNIATPKSRRAIPVRVRTDLLAITRIFLPFISTCKLALRKGHALGTRHRYPNVNYPIA